MSDMAMKYEDWLRGCVHHDGRKGNVYLPCDTVLAIADWIEAHRDAAPVRHGHWIKHEGRNGEKDSIECSACGVWIDDMPRKTFCPNCGARMDGENDDD